MDLSRRNLIKAGVAAALAPLFSLAPGQGEASGAYETPVRIIIPPGYHPPVEDGYAFKLGRAVLDFVQTHYCQGRLPVWGCQLSGVDLELRVVNVVYWVLKGVREHQAVYPVDPAWVMAQIMSESFFNEFAVSAALAVGVCQFIPATARSHGMLVAGDDPAHGALPYLQAEDAAALARHQDLRDALRRLRRDNARYANQGERLRQALAALVRGGTYAEAMAHLGFLDQEKAMIQALTEARERYRNYLKANFQGRDLFNAVDRRFLSAFDERVTYNKPVRAMVLMLAKALKARSGNVLAAAAGYNAGLSTTTDDGLYEPYGRIPSFEQTVEYVSRVVVNHHGITSRL